MKDNIEVLISEQDVRNRIREMADEISEQYRGKEVVLIGKRNVRFRDLFAAVERRKVVEERQVVVKRAVRRVRDALVARRFEVRVRFTFARHSSFPLYGGAICADSWTDENITALRGVDKRSAARNKKGAPELTEARRRVYISRLPCTENLTYSVSSFTKTSQGILVMVRPP